MFNEENHREFYSNDDYERVGGRKIDENEDAPATEGNNVKSSDGDDN